MLCPATAVALEQKEPRFRATAVLWALTQATVTVPSASRRGRSATDCSRSSVTFMCFPYWLTGWDHAVRAIGHPTLMLWTATAVALEPPENTLAANAVL